MSAKDSITTQTCELSKVEFDDFLTLYHIPSEYHVILPESNQTIFDAPPGYVRLYTHSFSLENLRLPLTEFFCEVLEYFKVHISRLNPFGCAKLTTFVVMCKAYSCEPSVDLFRGFFNLCQAGKWFTFSKRSENIFLIFFLKSLHVSWVGTSIFSMFKTPLFLPSQLLSEQNKLDSKSFKDKLPLNIKENPMFQHLSRYPTSVRIFLILFFSWMASNLRGNMASNDLQSWWAAKGKLKDATACHLKISAITPLTWKNHLDNHIDVELLDLHDHCYARQAVVNNAVNRRSRELLQVIKKLRVALREKISTLSTKVKEHKDRKEVVPKVVPYSAIKLVHSDDMGSLVGKLVSSAILYERCRAYEQVADMKEPFDLSKFMADPSAPIEVLLSKKPPSLQRPAPSRTQVPLPFSQKATLSLVLISNLMSPPVDVSIVKPQSSQL
ncbi:hypothetical protein Tco_1012552 [Tanacetum coccineum]